MISSPSPSTFSDFSGLSGLSDLAAIAEGEVGVEEKPMGSHGGPRVKRYQSVCGLAASQPTGWPWCAAFVCWSVKQFIARHPGLLAARIEANPPREASVYGLDDWARRIGLPSSDDRDLPIQPQRGDLVFYRFSHVEIVRAAYPDRIETVGGNTNDLGSSDGGHVALRTRSLQLVRRFARLVPRALPVTPATQILTR